MLCPSHFSFAIIKVGSDISLKGFVVATTFLTSFRRFQVIMNLCMTKYEEAVYKSG